MLMLVAVAAGGAGGALTRFLMTRWLGALWSQTFWATLAVNLIGCFVIGLLSALFLHYRPHDAWRMLFITGFLGSFTTYSTFTSEVLNLMMIGQAKLAFLHLSAHLVGGLLLCFAGVYLAKVVTVSV